MNTESPQKFEGHCIIELMGHNTIAGYISEQAIGGAAFVRVDVPECDDQPAYTKFFSGSAIYGITPTTEDIAKVAAQKLAVRPVSQWVVPVLQSNRTLVDSAAGYDRDDEPES